jgi:hypothetical protein
MGFFQAIGTKLNNVRHIGGKVLSGAAKIGLKLGAVAAIAGHVIAKTNPGVGNTISAAGRVVGAMSHAVQAAQSGNVAGAVAHAVSIRDVARHGDTPFV